MFRSTTLTLAFIAAAAVVAAPLHAAVYTWDGTSDGVSVSGDDNLNTGANWIGNTILTNTSHEYVFADASFRSVVDMNTGNQFNRDLGKFTFSGDSFELINSGSTGVRLFGLSGGPALEMATANTVTFTGFTTTFKSSITGSGTGDLVFNGRVGFDQNTAISTSATVVFNNATGNGLGTNRFLTVTNGTLLVNNTSGAGLGGGGVNVNSGALGGSGIIAGGDASNNAHVTIASGARLSPGNNGYDALPDVDTLAFAFVNANGRLKLNAGSLFTFDLAAIGDSDLILLTAGTLELNGQQFSDFTFNALTGFGAGTYTLFDSVNTTGSLGANLTGTIAGLDATLSLDGHDVILTVIPEPASIVLAGLGGLMMLLRPRSRA